MHFKPQDPTSVPKGFRTVKSRPTDSAYDAKKLITQSSTLTHYLAFSGLSAIPRYAVARHNPFRLASSYICDTGWPATLIGYNDTC
jgi:hypothetical protein